MWLSVRGTFRDNDPAWPSYVAFSGLTHLHEVRTLDSALNPHASPGDIPVRSWAEVAERLCELPRPEERQYVLLCLDAEGERLPEEALSRCKLLGHDLSDGTHTSTLLNCGRWEGALAPYVERMNRFGLLSLEDAIRAKQLLPHAWPGEPHAAVTVWALYAVRVP